MAFGDSAKKLADTANAAQSKTSAFSTIPQYLKIPVGETLFRLFPDDDAIQWKEFWLDVPITTKDGSGNETTKTESRAIILAVVNNNGVFEYAEDGQDPLTNWYWSLSEEDRKKRGYIRTRFGINVVNRNLVKKNDDGTVIPHEDGDPWNIVQILSHSGGKSGGKHTLEAISVCVANMRGNKGKPIKPHEGDIRIIRVGSGMDTKYSVFPGFNQDEVDFSALENQKYDLAKHYQPFPFEAITALMQGAEWNETLELYRISKFPVRVASNITEEDLPF